jgi:hypothetical protein
VLDRLAIWLLEGHLSKINDRIEETGCILCDREFSKVVANHLGFDLDLVELLAGVNTNDTANHFGDNDHVTKVCLDEIWFLVGFGLLLGLSQLLNQAHWFSLKTAVEPAASASVHDIPELFGGKVEEPVARAPLEPGSVYGFDGTFWVYAFYETTRNDN